MCMRTHLTILYNLSCIATLCPSLIRSTGEMWPLQTQSLSACSISSQPALPQTAGTCVESGSRIGLSSTWDLTCFLTIVHKHQQKCQGQLELLPCPADTGGGCQLICHVECGDCGRKVRVQLLYTRRASATFIPNIYITSPHI